MKWGGVLSYDVLVFSVLVLMGPFVYISHAPQYKALIRAQGAGAPVCNLRWWQKTRVYLDRCRRRFWTIFRYGSLRKRVWNEGQHRFSKLIIWFAPFCSSMDFADVSPIYAIVELVFLLS